MEAREKTRWSWWLDSDTDYSCYSDTDDSGCDASDDS